MYCRTVVFFLLMTLTAGAAPVSVIVDTDVGSDDLLAIAFLLARKDVRVEALTVVNGLAHVRKGADNLLRLLELSGHPEIPVYLGAEKHLQSTALFPDEWRRTADDLPGVTLPPTKRTPAAQSAIAFLAHRLRPSEPPVTVLALGPLTNLAQAFRSEPGAAARLQRLLIMGGAFHVPGNLGDGGAYKTTNTTAEWNIFSDPLAAREVFRSGAKIDIIPLDATSQVPIGPAFLKSVEAHAKTPLARFVLQVLNSERSMIEAGLYQAWDPLAAVALMDNAAVYWTPMSVEVRMNGPETGRTVQSSQPAGNTRVALTANTAEFTKVFLEVCR